LRGQVARRPTPNNKPHGLRLRSLIRRRTSSCMRFVTHRPRSSGNPPPTSINNGPFAWVLSARRRFPTTVTVTNRRHPHQRRLSTQL